MSGISDTMKYLSPAYMAYRGVKRKEMPAMSAFGDKGPLAAMSGAGPIGGLIGKDKKKPLSTIASGYGA